MNSDVVAAASAAAGQLLSRPVALASSNRTEVLRCDAATGGTVIVKCYRPEGDGAAGFSAEAAGLEFTMGTRCGPDLIGTDPARLLVVMSDLGAAPSLADLLLGADRERAAEQLLNWTRACGALAVSTAGREQEFASLRARQATAAKAAAATTAADFALARQAQLRQTQLRQTQPEHWLVRRIWELPDLLDKLTIEAPDGLGADLARVASLLSTTDYQVFSPGDLCPDNNLLVGDEIRFVDFESAEFHSAFLDAAYLSMPFSTCWCVFRLPADLAAQAQKSYRELLTGVFPALTDDAVWQPGVRLAEAAWTLHAMSYLLDRSMTADASMYPEASAAPTARQLLRHRWHHLARALGRAGELPAICALMSRLLTISQTWQSPALPLYPSFR